MSRKKKKQTNMHKTKQTANRQIKVKEITDNQNHMNQESQHVRETESQEVNVSVADNVENTEAQEITENEQDLKKIRNNKIRQTAFLCLIVLLLGVAVSIAITKKTTVNDIALHYTMTVEEEFDTEGSGEEPAVQETPAEEPAVQETPAEEPAAAESSEETLPSLPQLEFKSTLISTIHRPWIISDLSDMFRSLQ